MTILYIFYGLNFYEDLKTMEIKCLPFVQWTGGKRRMLEHIEPRLPENANHYYEPFLGGGAVFFATKSKFKNHTLSDVNSRLINTYVAVQRNPEKVYENLEYHYSCPGREHYEEVKQTIDKGGPEDTAAKLLYFVRNTYKTVYRENQNGNLQGTFDTSKTIKIHIMLANIKKLIDSASRQLQGASITCNDFSHFSPKAGDFVYVDPPYFNSDLGQKGYSAGGFGEDEHIRLKNWIDDLDRNGVHFMLSMGGSQIMEKYLYSKYKIEKFPIKYRMSQKVKNELLIRNY